MRNYIAFTNILRSMFRTTVEHAQMTRKLTIFDAIPMRISRHEHL